MIWGWGVATREESGVLGFPSRRGLTPRGSLECNPEIPAFPGHAVKQGTLAVLMAWLQVWAPPLTSGRTSGELESSPGLLCQVWIMTQRFLRGLQRSALREPGTGPSCRSNCRERSRSRVDER